MYGYEKPTAKPYARRYVLGIEQDVGTIGFSARAHQSPRVAAPYNRRTFYTANFGRHVLLTPAAVGFTGDQSCFFFSGPPRNAPNLAVNYGGAFSSLLVSSPRLSILHRRPTYATDAFLCGRVPLSALSRTREILRYPILSLSLSPQRHYPNRASRSFYRYIYCVIILLLRASSFIYGATFSAFSTLLPLMSAERKTLLARKRAKY